MDILDAVIIGVVEGLTEYLPISSTFHILLTAWLLDIPESDFLNVFGVFIQSGALLAVLIISLKDVINDKSLGIKALIAFLPTGIIAFLLNDLIDTLFFVTPWLQLVAIGGVAVIFLLVEWFVKKGSLKIDTPISEMTYRQAILIGVVQATAILPGVSRAGAVIVGLMCMNFRRDEAARFSFLLAIPTIFAASGYSIVKLRDEIIGSTDSMVLLAVGFIVSAVTAFFVVNWFLKFLKTHTLVPFAIYRIILVIVLLLTGYSVSQ